MLAAGHGYSFPEYWYPFAPPDTPTAHWSYLYTAFVAGLYAVFGVHPAGGAALVGAVLTGLLLPWLLYRLACRKLGPCTRDEALHRRSPRCHRPAHRRARRNLRLLRPLRPWS